MDELVAEEAIDEMRNKPPWRREKNPKNQVNSH